MKSRTITTALATLAAALCLAGPAQARPSHGPLPVCPPDRLHRTDCVPVEGHVVCPRQVGPHLVCFDPRDLHRPHMRHHR